MVESIGSTTNETAEGARMSTAKKKPTPKGWLGTTANITPNGCAHADALEPAIREWIKRFPVTEEPENIASLAREIVRGVLESEDRYRAFNRAWKPRERR